MEGRVLHIVIILTTALLIYPVPQTISGQDNHCNRDPLVLGLHAYYGMIIPHADAIKAVSHTNPRGFEFNVALHLTSENVWQYCYCYPRVGLSLHYVDFANPGVVGSAVALYPYVEPFIRADRKCSMAVRFGPGFSYQTTIYDEEKNPGNKFFGSHLAFIAMLNVSLNYRINQNISSRLTFSYNHISNGGTVSPNYGINYPMAGLGIDYTLRPCDLSQREKERERVLNPDRNRFDLAVFASGRESERFIRWYAVYGLWGGYSRMVTRVSAFYTGAELVSDLLVKANVSQDYPGEKPDHLRASVLAGHELVLGRFIFSQYAGLYFYSPVKARKPWYQRYALLYRFAPHTWMGVNARAHYHVIDFIDLRLVFSF